MQETAGRTTKLSFKATLLITVLLGLGIGLGIVGKNFWTHYSAERENIKNKINALSEKQQVISDLEDKLDRAEKDMRILLDTKQADANTKNASSPVKDAYLLARIAEDRLQYANDVQTAKQLLQLAQDQLAGINEEQVVRARAILAADQQKLSTLNYPDVRQVQDQLAIMDKLINNLALKKPAVEDAAPNNGDKQKNKPAMRFDKEWKQSLNKMLEDLKTVVKIKKKGDVDSDASLSYVNSEINKAQFKLLIEQIRWAVFYRDTVVYERSVKNAQELLTQIFDNNNDEVRQFSDALHYLAGVKIQPDAPNINDSVSALQAILVG